MCRCWPPRRQVVVPSMIGVIVSDRRIDDAGVDASSTRARRAAQPETSRCSPRPATDRWRCATVNLFVPARSRRAPIGKNSATSSCRSVAALPLSTVKRHCGARLVKRRTRAPVVIAASGSRRHDDGSAAAAVDGRRSRSRRASLERASSASWPRAHWASAPTKLSERQRERHSTRRETFRVVVGEKGR